MSSANRSTAVPTVPTIAEAGVPGYEVNSWQGLFAPGCFLLSIFLLTRGNILNRCTMFNAISC
ncbi:MAG: tripartite tricarboxylate transporter substrate-binding protein [Alcaligenaceae bacterium]